MLINRDKLKGQIAEKGVKASDIAKELGISRTAYYKRLNKGRNFKEDEIQKLQSIFGKVIFFEER